MSQAETIEGTAIAVPDIAESRQHSAIVRTTHWIFTISFFGLLVSGIAILLSHPRLYWGETGNVGTPSLIDLPLPFVLVNQNGWARHLHFLSAWISLGNGIVYVLSGILTLHFRRNLIPSAADLTRESFARALSSHRRLKRSSPADSLAYNVVQRLTYLVVIFGLFPLVIWTGLAMSPAITSVAPQIVTIFGGRQSARTIHFFVSSALVLFLFVHVVMISLAGFGSRVRPMITGHRADGKEPV